MAWSGPVKGRVIDVVDAAVLTDVTFVVHEAGRQRVIRDKAKGVHAFVQGTLERMYAVDTLDTDTTGSDLLPTHGAHLARIGYDPYKTPKMVREDCHVAVEQAAAAVATPAGVFAVLGPCPVKRRKRGLHGVIYYDVDGWNG
jgi:ribulose 1,5-bisphosphate carboxylase large subunit-like protein